nr:IS3 family transposase [Corynebacterium lactis]
MGLAASGFYYHFKQSAAEDKYACIRQVLHQIDVASYNTYGYRRMWCQSLHRGIGISEKVVRRLMRQENITPRFPRRRWRIPVTKGEISPAPRNLVNRNFHASGPNQLWLTDISVFATIEGRVYFSVVIDCFDGKVVAARTSTNPTMELAGSTLHDEIMAERPADDGILVLHSDRGAHCRGRSWQGLTARYGITRSTSKKGYSPDNAACEEFFGRRENELFYGKTWITNKEMEEVFVTYVEFYNNCRIKVGLRGMSIAGYRMLAVA